jgi:hypothetical protein
MLRYFDDPLQIQEVFEVIIGQTTYLFSAAPGSRERGRFRNEGDEWGLPIASFVADLDLRRRKPALRVPVLLPRTRSKIVIVLEFFHSTHLANQYQAFHLAQIPLQRRHADTFPLRSVLQWPYLSPTMPPMYGNPPFSIGPLSYRDRLA